MPRHSAVWWRESRGQWFTTIRGRQIPLGPDKRKATAEFHRLMAGSVQGPSPRGRLTVVEVLDLWLDDALKRVKPLTWRRYREWSDRFASFAGRLPATELRPLHIGQWLQAGGWKSQATQRLAVSVVKMAFRWAASVGWLDRDPIALCKAPTGQARAPAEPGVLDRVLASGIAPELHDILAFMMATGCRPGEARALEASGIAWEASTAMVQGKRGERIVVLPTGILGRLRELSARRPDGPVFRNQRGGPWTDDALRSAFRRARKIAGVEWVVASHARKEFATARIAAGVDSATVATLLGHASTRSLEILIKHYYFPDLPQLRAAVED